MATGILEFKKKKRGVGGVGSGEREKRGCEETLSAGTLPFISHLSTISSNSPPCLKCRQTDVHLIPHLVAGLQITANGLKQEKRKVPLLIGCRPPPGR